MTSLVFCFCDPYKVTNFSYCVSDILSREKLRGPGQRVKVGPSTQVVRWRPKKKKKKGHNLLVMTITTHHQPYLACYTAPLKNTVTALLEYLDLTALLEYIDLLNRYSGVPSWGLLGPLSGWGPGQNAPVAPPPPPWVALILSITSVVSLYGSGHLCMY